MLSPIASGVVAFLCGFAVSTINYFISRKILVSKPDKYIISTAVRQILNITLLIACYYVGEITSLSTTALLVGSVIGITIPSFVFTALLVKSNQKTNTTKTGKEEGKNG